MKRKKFILLTLLCLFLGSTAIGQTRTHQQVSIAKTGYTTLYYNLYNDNTARVVNTYTPYSGAVKIPPTVIYNGTTYTVTKIGDDISSGEYGFKSSSITSVEIPSTVTSIGDDAFNTCESLTSIKIPSSVTSIGSSAFNNCQSLTSIEFEEPSSLTDIPFMFCYRCESLTSINLPSSITGIGNYAFSFTLLTSIDIPSSVTFLGDGAFTTTTFTSATINGHIVESGYIYNRILYDSYFSPFYPGSTITIKNGGSVNLQGLRANSTYNFIWEKELSGYDNWHLMGTIGSMNGTYGDFLTTENNNDFAAIPFYNNTWESNYKQDHIDNSYPNPEYARAEDNLIANQSIRYGHLTQLGKTEIPELQQ